jgi:hypothetical protein
MIISASRRTDIPAFYSDWLLNRLREGYALVRNPFNHRQVSRVSLEPQVVDCLVFWTKNPAPLLPRLAEIERMGHRFLFQFTLTAYDRSLEPHVPARAERLAVFRRLAEHVGPERVLWRFDPIVFTRTQGPEEVLREFTDLAGQLHSCTRQCTVSFLSLYEKCRRNLQGVELVCPDEYGQGAVCPAIGRHRRTAWYQPQGLLRRFSTPGAESRRPDASTIACWLKSWDNRSSSRRIKDSGRDAAAPSVSISAPTTPARTVAATVTPMSASGSWQRTGRPTIPVRRCCPVF